MESQALRPPSESYRQDKESSRKTEVTTRVFHPENPADVVRLGELDVATRDTTVDVTGAEGQISEEDLRGWMEDPMLFAVENQGNVFGFVWFTQDLENPNKTPEVKNFLIQHAYRGRELVEMSHGELPHTPESQIIAGLKASIIRLAGSMGSRLLPVITAYTTDEAEKVLLVKTGFQVLGPVHQYVTRMDDGSLEFIDKPHTLLAFDPQVSR
jgi:hypothetical protein